MERIILSQNEDDSCRIDIHYGNADETIIQPTLEASLLCCLEVIEDWLDVLGVDY